MLSRFVDWAFRDRQTGRIVIGQWPNLWLWAVIVTSCLERVLVAATPMGIVAHFAATGSLLIWAGDEVLRGVNPWRRCLGAAVIVGVALRRIV